MNTMPPTAEMQQASRSRYASYHGLFFLGVRTTGIFCRPTCPARKPIAKNVEYFPTARAALVAGYRPCKRCRPLESDDQPQWASELRSEPRCGTTHKSNGHRANRQRPCSPCKNVCGQCA